MNSLQDGLRERAFLVADGAVGTMLQQRGLPVGGSPEVWNVERPDDVRAVHALYVEAGADLITTNTFGGTRGKLAKFGHEGRVQELVGAGIRLAREAADGRAWVWGSVGPIGELLEPFGDLTEQDASSQYGEVARAIAEAGADAVLFETFYDLNELRLAVEAGQAAGIPVFATMTFDAAGRTMMGTSSADAYRAAAEWGLPAFGANCSTGPEEMLSTLQGLAQWDGPALIAQPNAGMPETEADGSLVYRQGPVEMAAWAPRFLEAGAVIIGSCCGSTPDHTRQIRKALETGAA